MKTSEKIRTSFLLIVIFLLVGVVLSSNKPVYQDQNKINLPDEYKAVMYYNPKTNKLFVKGYDNFTYGLDSTIHEVDIAKGANSLYFVLFEMGIQLDITRYDE